MNSKRNCPLCGNSSIEKIYSINFPNNRSLSGLPENYDIVICNACLLVYDDISSSQEEYNYYYQYYSNYSEKFYLNNSMENKEYYYNIIDFFKEYIDNKSIIADIGCGSGILLKCLYDRGYTNLYGIDQSNGFNNIESTYKNIKFINSNIFINDKNLNEKFNFIVLEGMIEHIYDLSNAIKNVKNMLKDNGFLYISFPDIIEYHNKIITPFSFFNYEHISHFSKECIHNLAILFDLEIIKIKKSVYRDNNFPMINVVFKNSKTNNKIILDKNDIITSINKYIDKSKEIINTFIIDNHNKYIYWGVGANTLMLFSQGLEKTNITHIVDSSQKKYNKLLIGKNIILPSEIKDEKAIIMILPEAYYNDIYNQIKEMGLKNKVEFLTNRTEQNRTEQNRTEQNRTEQNRTEQNRTEQNR